MAAKLLQTSSSSQPPSTINYPCKVKLLTPGTSTRRKIQSQDHHQRISSISCCLEIGAASTNYRFQNKRPLTTIDLTGSSKEGAGIRVAYQGVSGAYSESAAEKAYPNCETVPCEQFDIAFQDRFGACKTLDKVEEWDEKTHLQS